MNNRNPKLTQTEKAIRFERPDYIPMLFSINSACWETYPYEVLWDLMESHPFLFPDFIRPKDPKPVSHINTARKDEPYTDDWGCLWKTSMNGIVGTVTKHPLDDWDKFAFYHAPNPQECMGLGKIDWEEERKTVALEKEQGNFICRSLRHGHTFLQLCDIRGYTNVLYDMYDEEPLLDKLLELITDFNVYIIQQYMNMGVDCFYIPEDLGMQTGPMLSPENFRRYILPSYKRMASLVKKNGTLLHMHSDGDIRILVPGLLECDLDVLNLQDIVNDIDWIRNNLKGKICIDLDIDRQTITPFGTPKQIENLIAEEVKKLGSPQGGLMMIYGLYPGVPIENIKALMDAMEKYAFYYS